MICPSCKRPVSRKDNFCGHCGCALQDYVSVGIAKKQKNTEYRSLSQFDLETVEGISRIPIPNYSKAIIISSPTNNIEYILQRKATEHAKNGKWNEAIACLKKSNEIMPYSNFIWAKKDYLRLVEFLKTARRFDEARNYQKEIDYMFSESLTVSVLKYTISQAKRFRIDLLITDDISCECAICSSLCRRIFSISGKDRRFPRLPSWTLVSLPQHQYCLPEYYLYWDGDSTVSWKYTGDLISWCNRPFIDERTPHQKKIFYDRVYKNEREIINRKNYSQLWEKAPEIAPKSFGGFMRMKNANTKNYMELVKKTAILGIFLNAEPDLRKYYL